MPVNGAFDALSGATPLAAVKLGAAADVVGVHMSFWVGVVCFAYLAFYALRASSLLRKQGIDLDQLAAQARH